MRIIFVHIPNDLYGASRSLLRIVRRSVDMGDVVHVVLPSDGPLTEALRKAGAATHEYERLATVTREGFTPLGLLRLGVDALFSARFVARLAQAVDARVVHSNVSVVLSGALGARLAGVPHVWHLRETFQEFPGLWRLYRPLLLALSDRIICNSQSTARQFGTPAPQKIAVVYNGFELTDIVPQVPVQIAALRHRYGLDDRVVAGVIGRVKLTRKGQDVFLRAAARLASRHPEAAFVCIGDAWPGNENHLTALTQMAQDAGLGDRFRLLGRIDDLAIVYALLDIAVMPSVIAEPFGNVVLEAMASALPVIASDNGGAAEQIVDGETGFLTPAGDDIRLAEAMGRLLSSAELRRRMGAAGRARFEAEFSLDRSYSAFRSHLKTIQYNR